ncbi:Wzz/FepE/Etk N-terminal domain-containing protein, partial [Campylobacter coli]|nr:Wzz/FepE/Etk N-terminal domain-containing protein [Campylobacter coli]
AYMAVRTRKRLIAAVVLATLALVMVYIVVWPPVYSSSVTLVANSDDDRQREGFYGDWAVFRRNALKDEVVLFTSTSVVAQVMKDMHLGYDDVYHPPLRYATHLWSV